MSNAPWENDPVDEPWLKDAEDNTPTPEIQWQVTEPKVEKGPFDDVPLVGTVSKALTSGLHSITPEFLYSTNRTPVTMDGPKGQEQIMDLPELTSNPYEGLNPHDRVALQKAYLNHPKTIKDKDGRAIYKGREVPLAIEDTSSGAAGGIWNAGRNTATLATAGAEYAGVLPEGSASAVEKAIPAYTPTNAGQAVISTGTELGVGFLTGSATLNAGLKAVQAAGKVKEAAILAEKIPQAVKYVAGVLGRSAAGAGGSAVTMQGSENNWLVGRDSYLFEGLDGKSETEAGAIIEDRINIFMDNMLLAAPVEMAADFGKKAGNVVYNMFLKRLTGTVNESVQQKLVMESIMDKVYLVTKADSPEQKAVLQEKLLTILKNPENRKIVMGIGEEGIQDVDVALDVETVIRRGLADDESEAAELIRKALSGQKESILSSGSGEHLQQAIDRPKDALKRTINQTDAVFNGPAGTNIDTASSSLQRVGQERVGAAQAGYTQADIAAETEQSLLPEIFEGNDTGKVIADAGNKTGMENFNRADAKLNEIAEDVKSGNDFITATKNENYDEIAIPKGTKTVGPYLESAKKLKAKLPRTIQDAINKAGNDLGEVVREVKPLLSEYSTNLREADAAGNYDLIKRVDNLRHIIANVEPKAVAATDPKAAAAIQKADDYVRDVFGKTVGDSVPKKVEEIRSKVSDRFAVNQQDTDIRKVISKAIEQGDTTEVGHLVETLKRPEYNINTGRGTKAHMKVLELTKYRIADKLRTAIKSSAGLGEVDIKSVLSTIGKYRGIYSKFPEAAKQIDELETAIIKNQRNVKELTALAEGHAKNLPALEAEIYDDLLKDFFHSKGETKSDAVQNFKDLFTGAQNIDKVKRLSKIVESSGDESVKRGWKAAYMRTLKSKLIDPISGVSIRDAAKGLSPDDPLMKIGDEVFKDKPIFMKTIRALLEPTVKNVISSNAKGKNLGNALAGAKSEASTINRIFLGPLSRAGTIAGGVTSKVIDFLAPSAQAAAFRDRVFAEPDEFIRILEKLQKEGVDSGTALRDAFLFLVKVGIYKPDQYSEYQSTVLDEGAKKE